MNPQYYGAAAEYNKPAGGGLNIKRLLVIIGLLLGVLAVIGAGLTLVSSLSKGPVEDFKTLISRTSGLQELMQKEQSAIRNGDLRKVNSESSVLLLSNIASLNSVFVSEFGESEGIAPEEDSAIAPALQSATANGDFDRTYAGILRDKVAAAYQQANKVAGSLADGTVKQSIQTLINDLEVIDGRLKALGL